jgi:hypothetical protein
MTKVLSVLEQDEEDVEQTGTNGITTRLLVFRTKVTGPKVTGRSHKGTAAAM